MENMYDKVLESVKYIKDRVSSKPTIGVILGSGLGSLVDVMENKEYIDYIDIPNFPQSSSKIQGHEGKLVFGSINGVDIMAMQGRFHYYEGYTMKEVTYPVFVMKLLGIEKLIVTNACGGINKTFEPGTLMIINDFINFASDNPLIGANDDRFGTRFPDMSEPYSLDLISKAKEVADTLGIPCREGVYAGLTGPYFETASEIRALAVLGADAVGMSTVPETIAANYLGIKVLGISCITNMATGIQKHKHSHEKVLETAARSSKNLCCWVQKLVETI